MYSEDFKLHGVKLHGVELLDLEQHNLKLHEPCLYTFANLIPKTYIYIYIWSSRKHKVSTIRHKKVADKSFICNLSKLIRKYAQFFTKEILPSPSSHYTYFQAIMLCYT